MSDHPELEFFDRLDGILRIELTEAPVQTAPHMLNMKAPGTAELRSIRFEVHVRVGDGNRELTQAELDSIAFDAPQIQMRGDTGEIVANDAPNGRHFTVRDLVRAVEETELRTRGASEWLGGIDVHHIFFEGVLPEADGTWSLCWVRRRLTASTPVHGPLHGHGTRRARAQGADPTLRNDLGESAEDRADRGAADPALVPLLREAEARRTGKVLCAKCGVLNLPSTAERTGGTCVPCSPGPAPRSK